MCVTFPLRGVGKKLKRTAMCVMFQLRVAGNPRTPTMCVAEE